MLEGTPASLRQTAAAPEMVRRSTSVAALRALLNRAIARHAHAQRCAAAELRLSRLERGAAVPLAAEEVQVASCSESDVLRLGAAVQA